MTTLVIGCADPRVQRAIDKICQDVEFEDEQAPYRNTRFGGVLEFIVGETHAGALYGLRAALPLVHRIILVDHDGGEFEDGCYAYRVEYADGPSRRLDPHEERRRHRDNLRMTAHFLRAALIATGRPDADDVIITTLIDHHTNGIEEIHLASAATRVLERHS